MGKDGERGFEMIFYPILVILAVVYLIFPDFVVNFPNLVIQQINYLIGSLSSILPSQSLTGESLFETVAQVLASILAIVFTISLFVIQIGSEKYSPRTMKYFKESFWTRCTFGISLFTILTCVYVLLIDSKNFILYYIVFGLFVVSILLFSVYYFKMIEIINPFKMADIMEREFIASIEHHDVYKASEILESFTDITIKTINRKETALTTKYSDKFVGNPKLLIGLYYEIQKARLSSEKRIQLEEQLFSEVFRILEVLIEKKDVSRLYLISILFDSIQWEVSKQEFVEEKEIDLLISKFVSEFTRFILDHDDFVLFKEEIHHISLLPVNNPRFIQEKIHSNLQTQLMPPIYSYDLVFFSQMLKEIDDFEFWLKYLTVKKFSAVKPLLKRYEDHEDKLDKYLIDIKHSDVRIGELITRFGTDRNGVLQIIGATQDSIAEGNRFDFSSNYKQLDILLISLKLHFAFYCIGALIIFKGKQQQINSAQYLKELWDHTRPDDASGYNLNETPILFEPLWLTYLNIFGGRDSEYWTRTAFGFSLGFDDYHGAEDYLYQYYILTITRCVQKGNSILDLPKIEELDNLKETNLPKLKEIFKFSNLFQTESVFLLPQCDKLISNAHHWDLLFDNCADELLKISKVWIQSYTGYCKILREEIIKRRDMSPQKIDSFSRRIIENYQNKSIIDDLVDTRQFTQDEPGTTLFTDICQGCTIRKEVFFDDDESMLDNVWESIADHIVPRERRYFLTILEQERSIEVFSIGQIQKSTIFEEIKRVVSQMKSSGNSPSIIIVPNLVIQRYLRDHLANLSSLIIDESTSLNIVNIQEKWASDKIIILDKSSGIWTYKNTEQDGDRLIVTISIDDDNPLSAKIDVKTTINYSILKPDAVKILKFDPRDPSSQ